MIFIHKSKLDCKSIEDRIENDGVSYVSTPDLTVQLETLGCNEELKKDILGLYINIKSMIEKW